MTEFQRTANCGISSFLRAGMSSVRFSVLCAVAVLVCSSNSYATFSIVAVDTVTGAVGSAGASCIAGSKMINDVVEGIGAINSQAYYLSGNQYNAHVLLVSGLTPDSVLSWLYNNDIQSNPERRQYGVVTLAGPGTSAAFTGVFNSDWKGHRVGPGYAIQGNILLGPQVVDTIQTVFLATAGSLEEKLMAALEAANIAGADTRCLSCNKPAISAFIKVVHNGDGVTPYLYEYVDNTECAVNPIPLLREQYNVWKTQLYADPDSSTVTISPLAIRANSGDSATVVIRPRNNLGNPPKNGVTSVSASHTGEGTMSAVFDNDDGTYRVRIRAATLLGRDTVAVVVAAGGHVTNLNQKAVLRYYPAGDADANDIVNISDVVYLIAYIFSGGPSPSPEAAGDADCSGIVNISDVVYLIAYIFNGSPAPCAL